METLSIEILHPSAIKVLEGMAEMDLIKIKPPSGQAMENKGDKMVKQYAGKLSSELIERLQNHVRESRQEWKQRDI